MCLDKIGFIRKAITKIKKISLIWLGYMALMLAMHFKIETQNKYNCYETLLPKIFKKNFSMLN